MAAKLQFGRPGADGSKSITKPMRFKLTVDAQRIVDSLRPALEPQLERIRSEEGLEMLKILDTKVAEADVIENFDFSKAAVLFLGFSYGFWSEKYCKGRGNKGKLKDASDDLPELEDESDGEDDEIFVESSDEEQGDDSGAVKDAPVPVIDLLDDEIKEEILAAPAILDLPAAEVAPPAADAGADSEAAGVIAAELDCDQSSQQDPPATFEAVEEPPTTNGAFKDRKGPLVPIASYAELPPPGDMGLDELVGKAEDFNSVRELQARARAEHRLREAAKKAEQAEKKKQKKDEQEPKRGNGRGGKRAAEPAPGTPPSKRSKETQESPEPQSAEPKQSPKPKKQSPKPKKSARPKQSPKPKKKSSKPKKSDEPEQSPKPKKKKKSSKPKKSDEPEQSPKPKKSAEPKQSPKPKKQSSKPKKSAEPEQSPKKKPATRSGKSGEAVATKDSQHPDKASQHPDPDRLKLESNLRRIMTELPIATPVSALCAGFNMKDFMQKSYTKYIAADDKAKLPPEHQSEVKGIEVNLHCNKFYVKRVLVTSWDGMPEDLVNKKFGADMNWSKFDSCEK
ncbi:hypothetical protein AK812_SmicGene151, partial [Symbiodinium microadriaticum]